MPQSVWFWGAYLVTTQQPDDRPHSPSRARDRPATAALCELILEQRPHPEQGFRACLGIVRLAGPYGADRLETAAERAIEIGARTYGRAFTAWPRPLPR